jgi:cobalt-zinc-cadmium efflux system outer membrane protein
MECRHTFPVILAGLLTAGPAFGQQLPPSPQAAPPSVMLGAPVPAASGLELEELTRLALANNPSLRQAALEVDAARGTAVQAGLYPNPTVSFVGEEIGRRGGIYTLPLVSQEIVTAGKLGLSRAAADRGVDQAQLALGSQRYALLAGVRRGYFAVLAIQRRAEVLTELVALADQSYHNARQLQKANVIAELDVLPFQVELERLRAEQAAALQEQLAAWQRLAALAGVPHLPPDRLSGVLESPLPDYSLEAALALLRQSHPAIQSARVGITRAELILQRAEVERVPNVTVGAGYQKSYNDHEDQATYQVSVPLPLFNRNQGNILKAKAELAQAVQEVERVANDLSRQLAAAYGRYAAARQRAERYSSAILPGARKAYELSLKAFRGGQFEYLRVVQAQQTLAQARLQYVQALGEAWQAAADLSGLLLEEQWPATGPRGPGCSR